MMDYLEGIKNLLENKLSLFASVKFGKLDKSNKSIAIRLMPSSSTSNYQDSRTREIQFQILSKSPSQVEALISLEAIANTLEQEGIEVYTEPHYLDSDEQGYTYSSSYKDEIG